MGDSSPGPWLANLHTDIYFLIFEHLDFGDIVKLSCSSSRVRNVVAPFVFRRLVFTSEPRSAGSALAAAKRYGGLVQELEFKMAWIMQSDRLGCDWQNDLQDRDQAEDAGQTADLNQSLASLRPSNADVETLLSGVYTPDAVRCFFKFPNCVNASYTGCSRLDKTMYDVPSEEAGAPWTVEVSQACEALASNRRVSWFELSMLPPKLPSAFQLEPIRDFIGRLTDLNLDVDAYLMSYWRCRAPSPAMADSFDMGLDGAFFDHARNLCSLRLELPLGQFEALRKDGCPRRPLVGCFLPRLRHLELRGFAICPALTRFLDRHRASLQSLNLVSCGALVSLGNKDGHGGGPDASYSWMNFYRDLADQPTSLRWFDQRPVEEPQRSGWQRSLTGDAAYGPGSFFSCIYAAHSNRSESHGESPKVFWRSGVALADEDTFQAGMRLQEVIRDNSAGKAASS